MDELEKRIIEFFDLLSIETNLKGYKYLVATVKHRYLDQNFKGKLYPCLYKKLAYEFGTSISAFERNIRTVLEVS